MQQVGLSYLPLGQPLSTLSGGERQRIKLAKNLGKSSSIIVMDEPTTGLHRSDVDNLLNLFDGIVSSGNTLVVIEHNLDVMKQADWIIDIGPDGGKNGGEVVFTGTPEEMLAKCKDTDSGLSACIQYFIGEFLFSLLLIRKLRVIGQNVCPALESFVGHRVGREPLVEERERLALPDAPGIMRRALTSLWCMPFTLPSAYSLFSSRNEAKSCSHRL